MRVIVCFGLASLVASIAMACGGSEFTASGGDAGGVDGGSDGDLDAIASDAIGPPVEAGGRINGRVVDARLVPIAGATVRVGVHSTTSAADGAFSLVVAAAPPYDAIVSTVSGSKKHGYVFVNLTRSDPTLQLVGDQQPALNGAHAAGTVLFPNSGATGVAFVDIPQSALVGTNAVGLGASNPTFNLPASWTGANPVNATGYALQWKGDVSGLPGTYTGWAASPTPLASGATAVWNIAPGSGPPNGDLRATIAVPSGYGLQSTTLFLRPQGSAMAAPIFSDKSGNPSPRYASPAVANASVVLCSSVVISGTNETSTTCRAGLNPNTNGVMLNVPPMHALTSPQPGAMGVGAGTQFSWTPYGASALYVAAFVSDMNPTFYVITTATSVKLPDLSSLGMGLGLPSGAAYGWLVFGIGPFANVDAAAGVFGYADLPVALGDQRGPLFDGSIATTPLRAFVTQ